MLAIAAVRRSSIVIAITPCLRGSAEAPHAAALGWDFEGK
jgi:hypothetical protein